MNKAQKVDSRRENSCAHPKVKRFFEWYLYLFEKGLCSIILFILIPAYYIYLITNIRQTLIEAYKPSKTEEMFDLFLTVFGVVNVAGNMIMGLVTNIVDVNSVPFLDSVYCEHCKAYRAKESYHCIQCNVCIFNRDHHCTMFSRCIGINNLRYYILYLIYVFFSMIYYSYHLYHYLDEKFKRTRGSGVLAYDFLYALFKAAQHPRIDLVFLLTGTEMELLLFFINLGIIIWMTWMIYYHGLNLLRGLRAHEADHINQWAFMSALNSRQHWGRNIVNVFGTKWYFAFFWPFTYSPPEAAKYRIVGDKIL